MSWKEVFSCSGEDAWKDKFYVDGERAEVTNNEEGLVFASGPEQTEDCHSVLWTRAEFEGDLRITFEYERLDEMNRFVNILYFQAQTDAVSQYCGAISNWKDERSVAYMQTYYENMDLLHISYAAFGNQSDEPSDYIRIRRYPVLPDRDFDQMEVTPTYFDTDLFKPFETYAMEFIKTDEYLSLVIIGGGFHKSYEWDLSKIKPTGKGPIGIRHMHMRKSRYKNFKVYQRSS